MIDICSVPHAASDVDLTTMQVALKCADVSHLAADPVLHHKWAVKLEEEMFRQGDLERAKNMAVSPLMDRHSSAGGITRTQAGLCERHAQPAAVDLTQLREWRQAHTSKRGVVGVGHASVAADMHEQHSTWQHMDMSSGRWTG